MAGISVVQRIVTDEIQTVDAAVADRGRIKRLLAVEIVHYWGFDYGAGPSSPVGLVHYLHTFIVQEMSYLRSGPVGMVG